MRPSEPVPVNCPSEPKKLHRLDITQINEAIEATKLHPLSQDSIMEQQTVSKEACKLSSKAALSREIQSYIKNGNHSIENQAPVVRKPISANPRLNRPNPRNKFVLRLNSVPRSSISTIQRLN